jgi:hypothetical protein
MRLNIKGFSSWLGKPVAAFISLPLWEKEESTPRPPESISDGSSQGGLPYPGKHC